ncbi:hypothetical protein GCK72_008032 [Caenorhabditis remanei]|uniref:F-box associated domain-containing protein n=1 Tax=Caenorhabditis remanei TaxID=31234 RepID=A0A6A5HLQ5_CAERE|nr:hypothetical protein GCK72_008032 [Caenorhabditis remanei]KAF1768071.1 hypothetical protein GCK72_008032 [Caenorhabditis remanei]
MSIALSYSGLRCVLEFLDPMRRIHIASRNHSLRTIEKTIPLSIVELGMNRYGLNLNVYLIDNFNDNKLRFRSGFRKDLERTLSLNLKPEKAMKKLLDSYLGIRSKIYVNCLLFVSAIPEFVPPNILLQINEFRCSVCYSEHLLPIIDPSSFPLKKLRTTIDKPDHLNHPVLTSAKELIVLHGFDGLTQLINQNNTNKHVAFEINTFRPEDLLVLIKNWMENGKEIGTAFKFHDYGNNQRTMHFLLEDLKEFKNERFNSSLNCPRLIIPINTTAEIHVSQDNENYIVVEVVPTTLKRESDATGEP